MKKIIFTIVLFLCIGTMNTAKAQTKEETIEWLKEKLQTHFISLSQCNYGFSCPYTFESVEINECWIKNKCKYYTPVAGGITERYTFIVPTQGLGMINKGAFYLSYEGIDVIMTSSTYKNGDSGDIHDPRQISTMNGLFGINTSGEVGITERIRKAITHLATFCPAKKKETF